MTCSTPLFTAFRNKIQLSLPAVIDGLHKAEEYDSHAVYGGQVGVIW